MKILVYENSAGFSNYSHKLCNYLSDYDGVEVYYLTNPNNRNLEYLSKKVKVLAELEEYKKYKKNSIFWLFNRITVSLRNIRKRNNICKLMSFDIVSIQSTIPVFDSTRIKKIKNCSIILTVHDVVPPVNSFYYSNRSLNKLYHNATRLVVHTDGNKRQLTSLFGISQSKICVIPHGTDTVFDSSNIVYDRDYFGLSKEKKVVLFYGMIREQKGLDDLIIALKGLQDIQLLIAGNVPFGESFDRYKNLIVQNGIDCVEMVRFIPEKMVDSLFMSVDFVCLPYKYFYSQSGVFMQCLKYRKPVVVSNVSSFEEFLVKYKIGLICKPNDAEDLHNKLDELANILNDDMLKNELVNNLEKAAKENSWDVASKMYLDLFSDSLESSK